MGRLHPAYPCSSQLVPAAAGLHLLYPALTGSARLSPAVPEAQPFSRACREYHSHPVQMPVLLSGVTNLLVVSQAVFSLQKPWDHGVNAATPGERRS